MANNFEPNFDQEPQDAESLVDPLDAILSQHVSPLPIGPDGAFMPTNVVRPKPIPAATADTFICFRGPCRYYMEMRLIADVSNPDVFDKDPIQIPRYCHRIPGHTINLMDEPGVPDCNEWYPYTAIELETRQNVRDAVNAHRMKE